MSLAAPHYRCLQPAWGWQPAQPAAATLPPCADRDGRGGTHDAPVAPRQRGNVAAVLVGQRDKFRVVVGGQPAAPALILARWLRCST